MIEALRKLYDAEGLVKELTGVDEDLQDHGEDLYRRIDARIEAMLYGGLLNEVRALRQAGYGNAFAMTGIGYREVNAYIDGVRSLEDVICCALKILRAPCPGCPEDTSHSRPAPQFCWRRR